MSHWASEYIGKPWVSGGTGPDEFDCFGLVRHVLNQHYGIDVPNVGVYANQHQASNLLRSSPELSKWTRVNNPEDGAIVMMARSRVPVHIGLCITANGQLGILHCAQPVGVLFQSPTGLKSSGFGLLTYYRYSK